MKIDIKADYSEVETLLNGLRVEQREKAEKTALAEGGEVVKKALIALPAPRFRGKRRGHNYHALDTAEVTAPTAMGTGYGVEVGFLKHKNHYLVFVDEGTSSINAQNFFLPAVERTQETQIKGMLEAIRKGLMLD